MHYTTIITIVTIVATSTLVIGLLLNRRRSNHDHRLDEIDHHIRDYDVATTVPVPKLQPFRGASRDRTLHGKARIKARRASNRAALDE